MSEKDIVEQMKFMKLILIVLMGCLSVYCLVLSIMAYIYAFNSYNVLSNSLKCKLIVTASVSLLLLYGLIFIVLIGALKIAKHKITVKAILLSMGLSLIVTLLFVGCIIECGKDSSFVEAFIFLLVGIAFTAGGLATLCLQNGIVKKRTLKESLTVRIKE